MGNFENNSIDPNQLSQYLKEGISMQDLVNLIQYIIKNKLFNK